MPATMKTPRDLLLHELGDVLYAEQTLLKVLPALQKETSDSELSKGFERHTAETRQQIDNIEQAFKALGEKPKAEKCPGIEGIKKEHDDFAKEDPSQQVLDLFNTGAAERTEHYEIAAYTGLVTMAKSMGETEVAKLLQQNLQQEEKMLKDVERIAERLAKASGNGAKA